MLKEKNNARTIKLHGRFLGGQNMKVHKYQIEVMWVFLATMFCRAVKEETHSYTYQLKREKSVVKESYNPIQIRPPPLGGE